jgi:zinc D-Ala-D-Ala dipeptidase
MKNQRTHEIQKRAYWIQQMDAAYNFMADVNEYPVVDCGERLVSLQNAVAGTSIEVVFSDTKLAGKWDRMFFLREGLIDPFLIIAKKMNDIGWVLKVEDAYRTPTMQKEVGMAESIFDTILQKVIWELEGKIPSCEMMLHRFSVIVASSPKKGPHTAGSAVDISVLDRSNHTEIDRGGPYIEVSELTPMASPFPSVEAKMNRKKITEIFVRHGFVAYPYEFWHYSSGDGFAGSVSKSGQPARYGPVHWDTATGSTTPIANPKQALHSAEEIQAAIEKALQRLRISKQF